MSSAGMEKRERREVFEEVRILGEPRRMLDAAVSWLSARLSDSS